MSRNRWQDHLAPGETLLWHGYGLGARGTRQFDPKGIVMGLVFIVFSIFWMRQAMSMRVGPHWSLGLIFVAVGIHLMAGKQIKAASGTGRQAYAIGSQNAYIAQAGLFGLTRISRYAITPSLRVELVPGDRDTVWFAMRHDEGSEEPVGFEELEDGREPYRLLLSLRDAAAEREARR